MESVIFVENKFSLNICRKVTKCHANKKYMISHYLCKRWRSLDHANKNWVSQVKAISLQTSKSLHSFTILCDSMKNLFFVLLFKLRYLLLFSVYFQLLPDLEYADNMTVLCVYNGPHMMNHPDWKLNKFIKRRDNLSEWESVSCQTLVITTAGDLSSSREINWKYIGISFICVAPMCVYHGSSEQQFLEIKEYKLHVMFMLVTIRIMKWRSHKHVIVIKAIKKNLSLVILI